MHWSSPDRHTTVWDNYVLVITVIQLDVCCVRFFDFFLVISAASPFLDFVLHFFKDSSCFFPIVTHTTLKGKSLN